VGITVSIHPAITGAEAADRLAIRELFDAYAHCADRRDAKGQMALFTEDTHFGPRWLSPLARDRAGSASTHRRIYVI
jgi:hypothetical protein